MVRNEEMRMIMKISYILIKVKKKMWIDFLQMKLLSKFLYTTNFFIYISVYIMFILFFQN
jgi:glycopeptide antibiotics resistance protein